MGWLSYAFWLTSLSRGLTYVLTFWTYLCADCTSPYGDTSSFLSSFLSLNCGAAAFVPNIDFRALRLFKQTLKFPCKIVVDIVCRGLSFGYILVALGDVFYPPVIGNINVVELNFTPREE